MSRREEYAETTRQAIVKAALRLFSDGGCFSTRVEEIAALARVAPATVYAVSGGKQGLLRTLVDAWTTNPIIAAMVEDAEKMQYPAAILRQVAANCRRIGEEYGDITRVMRVTAPHDQAVAESLAAATTRYRQAFVPISHHLARLGALRDGLDAKQALDVLWFYFGYSGFVTLHNENGWSYDRAERWLYDQAATALLRNAGSPALAPLQS